MKFGIQCTSEGGNPVSLREKFLGLTWLDQARKDAGVPGLDIDIVNNFVGGWHLSPSIPIPEEVARKSGLFENSPEVEVTVRNKALNRFASIETKIRNNDETGGIAKVLPEYEIDREAILQAWIAAGYPIQWEFEEEEVVSQLQQEKN